MDRLRRRLAILLRLRSAPAVSFELPSQKLNLDWDGGFRRASRHRRAVHCASRQRGSRRPRVNKGCRTSPRRGVRVHVRETVMSIGQSTRRSYWSGTLVIGAFCVVTSLTAPSLARVEGFLDFLFGVFQDHSSPKPQQQNGYPSAPPSAVGRIAPAPLGQESVNDVGGNTGHSVAFCVRLCDGRNFPMEQMVNGTPVETCRAICPYSRTKVFFGGL